jgi:WD40 repeat protein
MLGSYTQPVRGSSFSPNGSLLALRISDKQIVIRDLLHSRELMAITLPEPIRADLRFSWDGSRLVTWRQRNIMTWNISSRSGDFTLAEVEHEILDVHESPSGRRIMVLKIDTGRIQGRDIDTNETLWELNEHSDRVKRTVLSPDCRMLLSFGKDDSVWIWDVALGERKCVVPHYEFQDRTAFAFSPDGKIVALGCYFDQAIRFIDLRKGRTVAMLTVMNSLFNDVPAGVVRSLKFSRDGTQLLAASTPSVSRMLDADDSLVEVFDIRFILSALEEIVGQAEQATGLMMDGLSVVPKLRMSKVDIGSLN